MRVESAASAEVVRLRRSVALGGGLRSFVTAAVLYGVAATALPASTWALQPCESNCAQVTVGSGAAGPGDSVSLPVSFQQGPNDNQAGEGNDDVAAIAFTIGIPGDGSTPLQFSAADCADADGDGLPDAVTVRDAVASMFRVVIENVECVDGTCGCAANRDRCLCPGDGQTRDSFVNVVVFGPKDLPEQGPVSIPKLLDGELLRLRLQVAPGTPQGTIPIHIFSETDSEPPPAPTPTPIPKPQFAANLSIGDQAAIDQTADRGADRSRVAFSDGTVTVLQGKACLGDCNSNSQVSVSELITGVNIALGTQSIDTCSALDANPPDGAVGIDELIQAVNNAMNGCQ
jgi:hypothetical protein